MNGLLVLLFDHIHLVARNTEFVAVRVLHEGIETAPENDTENDANDKRQIEKLSSHQISTNSGYEFRC